jgi:hypothetical protein
MGAIIRMLSFQNGSSGSAVVGLSFIDPNTSSSGISLSTNNIEIAHCLFNKNTPKSIGLSNIEDIVILGCYFSGSSSTSVIRYNSSGYQSPKRLIFSNNIVEYNFFIKDKECYHKIDVGNVEKIVSDQGVIHIHLVNNPTTYTISSGLKQFQVQFPFEDLQRVNKSCIINLNHLKKFNGNYVWVNGRPISLGEKYKKDFYEKVNVFKTGWKVLSD